MVGVGFRKCHVNRYTFLLFLVSLNILLAIIVESFLRVKQALLVLLLPSCASVAPLLYCAIVLFLLPFPF